MPRALCGSILRLWDPNRPGQGRVRVGFAFVPARNTAQPAIGTLVPHEGGPGYSTTGTGPWYAQMYGPLLQRRNLLLVDQRGTGRSQPINCPALQDLKIEYHVAAGRCGRSLGARADDYTTARSADDLAEVITRLGLGPVDLYGDSYGTFFTQVFTGRHPAQVRSLVLDSAYPTYGESAYYPTQSPAMRHAFDVACTPLLGLPGRGPLVPVGAAAGAPEGAAQALARGLPRRRRSSREGQRQRPDVGRGRLRGDVLRPVLPRDDRRPEVRTSRRPQAAAAPRGRGSRWRHRRRRPGRLQRGSRRGRGLPRLPAALRHARRTGRAQAAVRRSPGPGSPDESCALRPVHRQRVRQLRLADARLVPALAGGVRRQPGRAADAARRLPARPRARAQRRDGLHHHAGRRTADHRAVPERRAGARPQQLPRHRRQRHRQLRPATGPTVRARARSAEPDAARVCRRGRAGADPRDLPAQPRLRAPGCDRPALDAAGAPHRPGRRAHRGRRRRPLVEQLLRRRVRAARRPVQLHRRQGREVPAQAGQAGPRSGRERPGSVGPLRHRR